MLLLFTINLEISEDNDKEAENEENKGKLTLRKNKWIDLSENMQKIFPNFKRYKVFERNINFRWFDIYLPLFYLDTKTGFLLYRTKDNNKYEIYDYNTGQKIKEKESILFYENLLSNNYNIYIPQLSFD